uniref:SON DNA binding protein n=1 Tax=Amphiprion percula TaxID=161767 RepID=A0A3P8SLC8_AMPPE
MAANIEQIFQDFILNKIREIEDQNEDRANGAEVVPSGEMKAAAAEKNTSDKHEDFRGSQKKHKKHKKHKSKKKKRNRDKESSCESEAEVERGSKHQSRRGTPTEARKERGADHESKSRCHKQHSTGKKKKKKKRRKGEENSSDSDSAFVSKQRESKCGQSLPLRRQEELPDIIPKQDSSSQGRADEERLGRHSPSHSNPHSHSDSVRRTSKHLHRRSRTRSRTGSPGRRTRSSSSEKRRDLDEALRSTKSPSERLQPQLDLRFTEANIRLEEMTESRTEDQPEKPGESKVEAAEQPASGCGTSQSTSMEPSFLQSKPAEGLKCPPAGVKAVAKKKRKQSRSPQRNRKSSKKQKRSRSPCWSYRRGSRSRSSSLKKRSRSRSRGRKSWRSRSRSASRSRRRVTYSQRDRWKREPSHSPVLILRKNRSPSRKHGSSSTSPQRISDLATVTAALSNMGTLSSLLPLPSITNKPPPGPAQASIAALEVKRKVAKQANSISIKEFTDKCQMIVDSTGELPVALPHVSDEEDDGKPFGGSALREQKVISFSINNTTVRPAVRSDAGMAKEFPVSSGSQHRKKEGEGLGVYGEWVPIDKTTEKASVSSRKAVTSVTMTTTSSSSSSDPAEAVVLPEAEQTGFNTDDDKVFPDALVQPVDITQAVTERIKAQRRLAENPYDISAICMLSRAQEQVDAWAQSNTVPGLFTGSTGAQVLSSEELSTSGPQAWLKKDQFLRAAPVSGGVGEFLMRKMGWKTGEGLGRNREGTVEPIVIDFKVDRKGLVAEGEKPQKQTGGLVVTKDLMGKHPVSALIELCNKRRIMQPDFVMVHHSGPDHRKNFLFKVTVNGVDYQPQTASPNKKHAKAMAATVALQALGEVPVDGPGLYTGPVFTAASTGPLFST